MRHYFEKGRPFAPGQVVLGEREGRCFTNAVRYARDNASVRYAEGIADGYLHAWCVDSRDRVVEVTWPELGVWYWGVR